MRRWLVVMVVVGGCVKPQQLVLADVHDALANRAEALAACFPPGTDASKPILVRFGVSPRGAATKVQLGSPESEGTTAVACALKFVEDTEFPISQEGALEVTLPLLPGRSLPVRDEPAVSSPGGLVQSQVMAVVELHKESIGVCVAAAQRKGQTGKVLMVWDVSPEGRVQNVGVRTAEFARAEVALCLADTMATWAFPAAEAATHVGAFPIKF